MSEAIRQHDPQSPETAVTMALAERTSKLQFEDLTDEAVEVAKHCILDWFGVTLAAIDEPLARILRAQAIEEGGNQRATLVGTGHRTSLRQAALVNGATSHALDYDDVHMIMSGHPTVPVLPAALALGEEIGATGTDLITALVAGYEIECRVGAFMGLGHYQAGWHATATVGSLGAAAACASLLKLDPVVTAHAFGIAGTQASGFKSMFGTMTKPFHAGHAAENGVIAATLAAKGFTSNPAVLETDQGFATCESGSLDARAALATPKNAFYIRDTLFKYHAACYMTHSSLEAAIRLRDKHFLAPDDIERVSLIVDPGHLQVCNILEPQTGLETKFSLRMATALVLAGEDTANPATFSDENARRDELIALRNKISVDTHRGPRPTAATVTIDAKDQTFEQTFDVGIPSNDLTDQRNRLESKFMGITSSAIGMSQAKEFCTACRNLESLGHIRDLVDIRAR